MVAFTSKKDEVMARIDGTLEEIKKIEMKPTTFVADSNLRSKLSALAAISHQSLSAVCRDCITLGLEVIEADMDVHTKERFDKEFRSIAESEFKKDYAGSEEK